MSALEKGLILGLTLVIGYLSRYVQRVVVTRNVGLWALGVFSPTFWYSTR